MVHEGIKHLVSLQNEDDGLWGKDTRYPTAITALAGLAILGGGNTPLEGPYTQNLERVINKLLKCQSSSGWISCGDSASMYGHGFATLFLSQIYGMSEDERIGRALKNAVLFIERFQSERGGWYYEPSADDEGSVTIVQVQALRAVQDVGITVKKQVIEKAMKYVRDSQVESGGIAYEPRQSNASFALTAAGMAVLLNAGDYEEDSVKTKGFEYIKNNITFNPQTDHFLYAHFYAAQIYKHEMGRPMPWDSAAPEDTPPQEGGTGSLEGYLYFQNLKDILVPALQNLLDRNNRAEINQFSREGFVYNLAMTLLILETEMGYLSIRAD
ncbi:MAG: terpene cyclase/mutase family protein [Deltaproteobacteria bacterium]|nr:terpene cyclase/mutase family protein [Deltaproteobacteria bacterium]